MNDTLQNRTLGLYVAVMALIGIGAPIPTGAQTFSAGSDGSDGALEITENTTMDLPPDGILHLTTFTVAPGTTLTFNRNALNTPVYALATDDVLIEGTIDVDGQLPAGSLDGGPGGPGGFDGGVAGSIDAPGGAGQGPGSGRPGPGGSRNWTVGAGGGAFGTRGTMGIGDLDGTTYGSPLLMPLTGGSGGGGAILIASDTRIVINGSGLIFARGGRSTTDSVHGYNGGSGGAVRLVAPRVFGNGTLNVEGGVFLGGHRAGDGRIRVDSLFTSDPDGSSLAFTVAPVGVATFGSTMLVFPPGNPHLDIVHAAGTPIPEGTTSQVLIQLPLGADTNQTVTVQARNFSNSVPISVVLTPTSGDPKVYDAVIDNDMANPAQISVDVQFPVNQLVHVNAWTR